MEAKSGVSLIEVLLITAIIGILIAIGIFTWKLQLAKGKDGRRKADLKKLQNVLEDYMNDNDRYPAGLDELVTDGYLSEEVTGPIGESYEYELGPSESWYKIYTKLDNENDSIIDEVDCRSGCGPGGTTDYNYFVASPNVGIAVAPAGAIATPPPGATSTPTPPPGTPPPGATSTPTSPPGATSTPPGPTPTPTLGAGCVAANPPLFLCPLNACNTGCPGSGKRCWCEFPIPIVDLCIGGTPCCPDPTCPIE